MSGLLAAGRGRSARVQASCSHCIMLMAIQIVSASAQPRRSRLRHY